jgi:hypothetical protein
MKVYVMPADAYGCGHYRSIWPSDVLKKQGLDVSIIPPSKESGFLARTAKGADGIERLTSLGIPEDADVIVIQRPAHPLQPQMIKMLRQNGIAVVVDMDDDMSTIHPDNTAFHMYRPHSATAFSWRYATESCREASFVTTSTVALQKTYAPHGRGMVIDNFVPAAYLNVPKQPTGSFGWAGTTKSHPNDLQGTRPAVQKLMDMGHMFTVVGDGKGVKNALGLKQEPLATGTVSLKDWVATIAGSMDVGIIPLAPTSFNTAKSRLKGIESFAAKVPWVAAPRAEYRRLVKESGAGLLAETPKEWQTQVHRLMTDDVLRKEQVEAGMEYMRYQTYENQAWRWWEAWDRAYHIERGMPR